MSDKNEKSDDSKKPFAGTVKRLNQEYEKIAQNSVAAATSRDAAVSREIKVDWNAIRQRYDKSDTESPRKTSGSVVVKSTLKSLDAQPSLEDATAQAKKLATQEKQRLAELKKSENAPEKPASKAPTSSASLVKSKPEVPSESDTSSDEEDPYIAAARAAAAEQVASGKAIVEPLSDSEYSGSYEYESQEDHDMTVVQPDEQYGQYDWATLEAELLGDDAGNDDEKKEKTVTVEEDDDDIEGSFDDDSEIRRMQEDLEASSALDGVDILSTLAALEAPDEQLLGDDDDENDSDDAPTAAATATSSLGGGASSEDESSDDDASAGEMDPAEAAALAKLSTGQLVKTVWRERRRATEAKSTISSLIDQITEYQTVMEDEKLTLERQLKQQRAEIAALEQLQTQREKELSAFYESKIDELTEAVEAEKQHNKNLSNETINNLQTLMVELQNIEQANQELHEQLADERANHAKTLTKLDKLDSNKNDDSLISSSSSSRKKSSRATSSRRRMAKEQEFFRQAQAQLPKAAVSASDIQSAIDSGDAKLLSAVVVKLRSDNEKLREDALKQITTNELSKPILTHVSSLLQAVHAGLNGNITPLTELDLSAKPMTIATPSIASPRRDKEKLALDPPSKKAPRPTNTVKSPPKSMQTMPAMAGGDVAALKAAAKAAAKAHDDIELRNTDEKEKKSPTKDTTTSPSLREVSPTKSDNATPTASRRNSANKQLVEKMQKLITSHEETLQLLAKSKKINALIDDAHGLPRLSTRESISIPFGQSMLSAAPSMSAAELERRVRLQRRKLGLALQLNDLPEPIHCLLDVGTHVWSGGSDGHVAVYSKATRRLVEIRNTGAPSVAAMVKATDKTVWGTSAKDALIYVWSIKNGKLGKKISGHEGRITSLCVVNKKYVWSASTDLSIRVWNAKSFKFVKRIPVRQFLVSLLTHGGRVWTGTENNIMRWDPVTYRPVDVLRGHTKMVTSLVSVGDEVWSASADRNIIAWQGDTGAMLHKVQAHDNRVLCLVKVNEYVWSCAADKSIKVWDTKSRSLKRSILGAHDDQVTSLIHLTQAGSNKKQTNVDKEKARRGEVWSGSLDNTIGIWSASDRYLGASSVSPSKKVDVKNTSLKALLSGEGVGGGGRRHRWAIAPSSIGVECALCHNAVKKSDKMVLRCIDCASVAHQSCVDSATSVFGCEGEPPRNNNSNNAAGGATTPSKRRPSNKSATLGGDKPRSRAPRPGSVGEGESVSPASRRPGSSIKSPRRRNDGTLPRVNVERVSSNDTTDDAKESGEKRTSAAESGGDNDNSDKKEESTTSLQRKLSSPRNRSKRNTLDKVPSGDKESGGELRKSGSRRERHRSDKKAAQTAAAAAAAAAVVLDATTPPAAAKAAQEIALKASSDADVLKSSPSTPSVGDVEMIDEKSPVHVLNGTISLGYEPVILAHPVALNGSTDTFQFRSIRARWPKAATQFSKWHSKRHKTAANFKLGSYQLVQASTEPPLWIANLLVCDEDGTVSSAAVAQVFTNLAVRAASLSAAIHVALVDEDTAAEETGGGWHEAGRHEAFVAQFFRIPQLRIRIHRKPERK